MAEEETGFTPEEVETKKEDDIHQSALDLLRVERASEWWLEEEQ